MPQESKRHSASKPEEVRRCVVCGRYLTGNHHCSKSVLSRLDSQERRSRMDAIDVDGPMDINTPKYLYEALSQWERVCAGADSYSPYEAN